MARQIGDDIQAQGQFKLQPCRQIALGRTDLHLLRFSVFLIVAHRYLLKIHCITRFFSIRRVGTCFSHIHPRIPYA